MWQRRRAALVALACGAAAIALGAMLVLSHPVRESLRLALLAGALATGWQGPRRTALPMARGRCPPARGQRRAARRGQADVAAGFGGGARPRDRRRRSGVRRTRRACARRPAAASGPVLQPAFGGGIDGEARMLAPPLRFRSRPAALRCRIARHHPGASPAAFIPERARDVLRALVEIASGRPRGNHG